jgi:hypothetical protein
MVPNFVFYPSSFFLCLVIYMYFFRVTKIHTSPICVLFTLQKARVGRCMWVIPKTKWKMQARPSLRYCWVVLRITAVRVTSFSFHCWPFSLSAYMTGLSLAHQTLLQNPVTATSQLGEAPASRVAQSGNGVQPWLEYLVASESKCIQPFHSLCFTALCFSHCLKAVWLPGIWLTLGCVSIPSPFTVQSLGLSSPNFPLHFAFTLTSVFQDIQVFPRKSSILQVPSWKSPSFSNLLLEALKLFPCYGPLKSFHLSALMT